MCLQPILYPLAGQVQPIRMAGTCSRSTSRSSTSCTGGMNTSSESSRLLPTTGYACPLSSLAVGSRAACCDAVPATTSPLLNDSCAALCCCSYSKRWRSRGHGGHVRVLMNGYHCSSRRLSHTGCALLAWQRTSRPCMNTVPDTSSLRRYCCC